MRHAQRTQRQFFTTLHLRADASYAHLFMMSSLYRGENSSTLILSHRQMAIEARRVLLTATIWSCTLASKSNLVVLGLLQPPIGGRLLGVKSSPRLWPPTASSECLYAMRMVYELEASS